MVIKKEDIWRWIKKAFISDSIIPFVAIVIFGILGKISDISNIKNISELLKTIPFVWIIISTAFYLAVKGFIIEYINRKIR